MSFHPCIRTIFAKITNYFHFLNICCDLRVFETYTEWTERYVSRSANQTIMKRILVVDDDAALLEVLAQTLSQAGYTVATAANGGQARAIYRIQSPDVVITDIYMLDKDGLEVLSELRRHFPGVKVIAMSGAMSKDNMLQVASALGASLTLAK